MENTVFRLCLLGEPHIHQNNNKKDPKKTKQKKTGKLANCTLLHNHAAPYVALYPSFFHSLSLYRVPEGTMDAEIKFLSAQSQELPQGHSLLSLELVSWCFEPSQPQRIISGLLSLE